MWLQEKPETQSKVKQVVKIKQFVKTAYLVIIIFIIVTVTITRMLITIVTLPKYLRRLTVTIKEVKDYEINKHYEHKSS